MKFGANSVLFAAFDLETAMQQLSWSGYDGIELSAIQGMCEHLNLDTYKEDAAKIKDLASQYNLELLAIELASLDPDRVEKCCAAAALLGIPVVNVGPGGVADQEGSLDEQIKVLAAAAARAEAHGVVLCCKAHVGASIYSTPTTLKTMASITSPGFGIDMDPSHIYRCGEDPVAALPQVISRVKHIHIRDCVNKSGAPGPIDQQTCGRGDINLRGYIKILKDSGYNGPVDLEIIGAGDASLSRCAIVAAESRGYLNACLKSLA
jgi:sugar phosphate isomerase/epimerase